MSSSRTTKKKSKVFSIQIPKPDVPEKTSKRFPIPLEEINRLKKLENEKLVFSFRFLELEHEAFNLGGTCNRWSNDLFKLLRELSGITRNDFVNKLQRHYRSHTHDWNKLDYKYNFSDDFLEQVECRQARISTSKGGIHGFIIGNRFYVVWLDPHHNLYPDDRYGGVKIFQPPDTCCGYRDRELEKLNREIDKLNKTIREYEELLEELTSPK